MQHRRRNHRYNDRHIQGRLLLHVVGCWIAIFAAIFLLGYVEFMFSVSTDLGAAAITRVWYRHSLIFVGMIVVLPAMALSIVTLSYRFVGPVERMRSVLQRCAAGEPFTPIKLRKRDFWHGLASDLNAAWAQVDKQGEHAEQRVTLSACVDDCRDGELVSTSA